MRYFWCWVFPPIGMLSADRPLLAVLNLFLCLTCVGFPFAAVWSYMVAAESYAEERNDKLIRAMRRRRRDDDDYDD